MHKFRTSHSEISVFGIAPSETRKLSLSVSVSLSLPLSVSLSVCLFGLSMASESAHNAKLLLPASENGKSEIMMLLANVAYEQPSEA